MELLLLLTFIVAWRVVVDGVRGWPKAQNALVEMSRKALLDCHDLITPERPDHLDAAVDVIAMALAQT